MDLPEFFRTLDAFPDAVPIDRLVEVMRRLEIGRDDVEPVVAFDPDHYKRNVLRVGPGYAALVLCWSPGQASPIHDHRGSACGVLVLEGELTETKYARGSDRRLREGATTVMPAGEICGSYDADIHVIRNAEPAGGTNLITLHVYTPPLREFSVYSLDSAEVTACFDRETYEAQQRAARAPAEARR